MRNRKKKKQKQSVYTVQNSEKENLGKVLETEPEELIALANFIFEQNKMQQETKDEWFGHYLSILGGVSALTTVCLTILNNTVDMEIIYCVAGIAFLFTGVVGGLFFSIFLCQRANYWKNYKLLNELQILLIKKIMKHTHDYYYPKRNPFAKRKHGADFWAVIVEDIMVAICFAIGTVFIMAAYGSEKVLIVEIALLVFLITSFVLFLVYKIYEKHNKI